MRKISLTLLLAILLIGCGNKIDDEALVSISKALDKRWEYTETITKEVTLDELRNATQAELDVLPEYDVDDFKDRSLYVLYDGYVRELNNALFIIRLGDITDDDFAYDWQEHIEKRAKILHDINDQYTLSISDENQVIFEDVISEANELVKAEIVEDELLEIKDDIEVIVEDKSVSITFPTESVLSTNSFVSQKIGFPEIVMEILEVTKSYDYEDVVIATTNQDVFAVSSYFTKESLHNLNFDRWEELDSHDAYKFYGYTDAYYIRIGVWNELDTEVQQLIGDMKKDVSNPFWKQHGYTH